MDKEQLFKTWAEKLQITVEEVKDDLNNILATETDETKALRTLALQYRKQLRSPAVPFEGIVIGASDSVDIIAKQRREAEELYRTDPQLAISQGVTNEEGVPLETRKEWSEGRANPNYGKPLPQNNFIRNVWVIAKKQKGGNEPKLYNLVLSGKNALNEDIPLFKPCKFMAIDKGEKLNASQFTKFVVDEKIQIPNITELVKSLIPVVKISELEQYHQTNKDNFNRFCLVEADASYVNLEPTAFGSRVVQLEDIDASIENLDAPSLTCWIPSFIDLDFIEGSKVLAFGRTSQGKKKDETGNLTEELANVSMNCFGIYAIPEYKVGLPNIENKLSEEALD